VPSGREKLLADLEEMVLAVNEKGANRSRFGYLETDSLGEGHLQDLSLSADKATH
jgi:hypothetical protein